MQLQVGDRFTDETGQLSSCQIACSCSVAFPTPFALGYRGEDPSQHPGLTPPERCLSAGPPNPSAHPGQLAPGDVLPSVLLSAGLLADLNGCPAAAHEGVYAQ